VSTTGLDAIQEPHWSTWLAESRVAAYGRASKRFRCDPIALLEWEREFAVAVFRDVAVLELAMRASMSVAMEAAHGDDWVNTYAGRWSAEGEEIAAARNRTGMEDPTLTQVVGHLMFGYWVMLLSSHHEGLWRTYMRRAFPGLKTEAARLGKPGDRKLVAKTMADVQAIRNAVAHHSILVEGVALTGRGVDDREPPRIGPHDLTRRIFSLAVMTHEGFGAWLAAQSRMPSLLEAFPRSTGT